MSMLLGQLARLAARRLVFDPKVRAAVGKAGQRVAEEAKTIARDPEPARAAGRTVRRAFDRLQGR